MMSLDGARSRDALRGRGDRFVAAHPRPHEALDARRDRPVAERVDHEQRLHAFEVAVDRGADQVAAIGEVAVHGPQRDPGAARDLLGRRAEVAFGEQLEHGVERGHAIAVAAGGAAVGLALLIADLARVLQHLTVSMP